MGGHGVRNVKPNASHFMDSFKSLLINNFMAVHSPGQNCQEDVSSKALDNLRYLLTGEIMDGVQHIDEQDIPQIDVNIPAHRNSVYGKCTATYIAGFLVKKILKTVVGQCQNCTKNFLFTT